MHDRIVDGSPTEPLMLQAMLYASGELEGTEAAAFEQRLGQDQAARDALCQAVQLAWTLDGSPATGPDPRYRQQVRRRLRRPAGSWQRLLAPRRYRGHPALWASLGAAVATLLVALVMSNLPHHSQPPALTAAPAPVESPGPAAVEHPGPAPLREKPSPAPELSSQVAELWAEMNNSEHLQRARAEEARRKSWVEERYRLLKSAERRVGPVAPPMMKN